MTAASSPNIVELFNAHLADEGDLRTAPNPAPALPNKKQRRKDRGSPEVRCN